MSQRFGPDARLRQRREFKALDSGGRRLSGRFFTLIGKPNGGPQDRLGIVRAEVGAIGDNLNDQDMVSWAGFGIAMGNAPEALKASARYVTGRIGEGGVAQAIERFVIGKEEPTLRT